MQINDLIEALENPKAKDFILRHLNDDVTALSLNFSKKNTQNLKESLQLISLYQRAQTKLPYFISQLPVFNRKSYEQSSSEKVAEYKSRMIRGTNLLDLSAGLGIDDIAFSSNFDQIDALDPDEEVHISAMYNLKKLGLENIRRIRIRAEDFVPTKSYDWIYIDPDRRSGMERKHSLEHLHPEIPDMLKRFHSRSGWMIKLSPLFDLKEVERKFEFLKEIHIISENNEVKEVCVILDKENHYELRTIAVDLGINHFQYQSGNASSCKENWDIKENQYLYIPFACLVKAGLDSEYLSSFHLEKLAHYSLYFSSENLQIPGTRKYRIRHVGSLSHKVLASHLKLLETRDFNLVLKGKGNRANWMKVLKLKEGSENLLFILNERRKLSLMAEFIRT